MTDPCRSCAHTLSEHVSHLLNVGQTELNQLLSLVGDVENLFICVNKEEDSDNKQVYFCLFKVCFSLFEMDIYCNCSYLLTLIYLFF